MTTFATLATDLATATHRPADVSAHKDAIVAALRALRGQRVRWGEGSFQFVGENGVSEYPMPSRDPAAVAGVNAGYPRIPGDIMSIAAASVSHNVLSGAVIKPDTLLTQTNLTGSIADVQDSAQAPDDDYLDPTTAASITMKVRWDDDLPRPLLPGTSNGSAGLQVMRVAMYNEGTNRTVGWEIFEGVTSIASGTWTVASSNPLPYDASWDASKLSTLDPAGEQISLEVKEETDNQGDVHIGAVQWFAHTRDQQRGTTGGTTPLVKIGQADMLRNLGGRVNIIYARPRLVSWFNETLWLYPTMSGSYLVDVNYQLDSTRDSVTGAKITSSSTTETNGWFDEGYAELKTAALAIYYRVRSHDAKAAALADAVVADMQQARNSEYESEIFSGSPPVGSF